jgi:signal transduction histidine kinase
LLNFAKSPVRARGDVAIDEEIERVVTLLAPEARKRGVHLDRLGNISGIHIYADADQLRQVLINIVLNGIQAVSNGGSVAVTARQVVSQEVGYCQIEIEDTGPGISEGLREEIFNPFFTTKSKGTGLGLSIAHQIVAEHGGFISLETGEGSGARFLINFPLCDELPTREGSRAVESRVAALR